jgi:hypothetical protein
MCIAAQTDVRWRPVLASPNFRYAFRWSNLMWQ